MKTLRSAGYFQDALYVIVLWSTQSCSYRKLVTHSMDFVAVHTRYLAVKHAKHDWYFKLQLEDLKEYAEVNRVSQVEMQLHVTS